ncbi:MAG: hypothetical protein LBH90_10290 [Tannerella sp.]|jgi:hypothetical protein|nr:hypothetical protein [Tannerella sp.]
MDILGLFFVLWGAAFLLPILFGTVGVGMSFALSITGLIIYLPKKKQVEESFGRFGITETDLKQAINACNKRIQP